MPSVKTDTLEIHYLDYLPSDNNSWPVVLSHGFPYDVHAYDEVVPILLQAGARVIVPYLRGFGPTRFLDPQASRTGQQAALATDLISLLNALNIPKAILAGFDWGGLASCTATALFPDRVVGLVSYAGYDVIDIEAQKHSCHPSLERVVWYQHLFQSERGRECLGQNRRDLCKILWKEWSPSWASIEQAFERTAPSFDNPDFVDVVIHCYRFHFGGAEGDPSFDNLEARLAQKPPILVPAITLDGTEDPLKPGGTARHAEMFQNRHERKVVNCGHNMPQEAPKEFADAIIQVHQWTQEAKTGAVE